MPEDEEQLEEEAGDELGLPEDEPHLEEDRDPPPDGDDRLVGGGEN